MGRFLNRRSVLLSSASCLPQRNGRRFVFGLLPNQNHLTIAEAVGMNAIDYDLPRRETKVNAPARQLIRPSLDEFQLPPPSRDPAVTSTVYKLFHSIVCFSRSVILPSLSYTLVVALGVGVQLKTTGEEATRPSDGFTIAATDWPWWRGAERNGTAASDQSPPLNWSESKNVAWKAPIPGRGHGSMCIVGDSIYLQTADETTGAQFVLCINRTTGAESWKTTVHASGGMRKNERSTAASSTPACDGKVVYVSFPNDGALVTSALDIRGKLFWQTKVSGYVEHQGYGASPALYQSMVIVSSDNKGGGAVAALDRTSGSTVWTRERAAQPNYSSPVILHVAGKDQVIMTGCDKVTSFDPMTGKTLWEIDGATTECVTSTVTDGTRVFSSGGYPRNHMSAIAADGSGKVQWENGTRLYVPSLLIRDGHLYGTLDAGIAVCWNAETGEELWKNRLGGNFSASPVLVGDKIFATNESGETFIFRASPHGFEELAKNQLGSEVFSTPVICGGRVYYRAATVVDGVRKEHLYCLADS